MGRSYGVWSNDTKGKSLKVTLCKLAFETVVYHIWKQRNDIRHDNVLKIEEQILKGMHWEIRSQSDGCGEIQEVIRK